MVSKILFLRDISIINVSDYKIVVSDYVIADSDYIISVTDYRFSSYVRSFHHASEVFGRRRVGACLPHHVIG